MHEVTAKYRQPLWSIVLMTSQIHLPSSLTNRSISYIQCHFLITAWVSSTTTTVAGSKE